MNRQFDTPIITNDQSVDRVLAVGLPVVLVFLAGSTPSDLEQAMDRLANRYAGQILVVKIDQKENPITARRYKIHTTPAVVTVHNNQTVSQAEAISATDLEKHVAFLLGKGPKPAISQPTSQRTGSTTTNGVVGTPLAVTSATFEKEVMQSRQPVLVDFWAPWCGPCRMVEPTLKKLAKEYAGRLRVAKVNVDENQAISQQYGVQGIPTMLIVRNGQIIDRWSGALPEPALRSKVQQVLGV